VRAAQVGHALVLCLLCLQTVAGCRLWPFGQTGPEPRPFEIGRDAWVWVVEEGPGVDRETEETLRLTQLARIFYGRVVGRRFNSISTYHDPALREFFTTGEAFADYYADLAQALADTHFEANRPTDAQMELVVLEAPGAARIRVRLRGKNGQPLRPWPARLVREDAWRLTEGRWFIIPGKL